MLRWLPFLIRPFGIGLGLFILVNFALALKASALSANQVWLSVPLREPYFSIFGSVLGIALLIPNAWGSRRGLRILQGGIFLGFLLLALSNVFRYYDKILHDEISTRAAFPFSLLIALILVVEMVRVTAWSPVTAPLPAAARRFFGGVLVVIACYGMILAHIYTFGLTDYSGNAARGGVAVVLGAKVYPDYTLSDALADRMAIGVRLVNEGVVDHLILSGGIDANGLSEPRAMERFALENGVASERVLLDEDGKNTFRSAVNCADIARQELGLDAVIVVSQYFHNARVKLIFERAGVACYTTPADPRPFRREAFFLFREAVAYSFYLLFRH